jgi:hypothetical protein
MKSKLLTLFQQCPVFDQAANIQFQGYWQTLTSQGSITVRVSSPLLGEKFEIKH